MDIVDRMNDVRMRYGAYDLDKWNTNLALKDYFEQKMGRTYMRQWVHTNE